VDNFRCTTSLLRDFFHNLKVSLSGCDILEILEINHKNGGGHKEMRQNYHGNTVNFLKDIR
jgi:hypothetical protein